MIFSLKRILKFFISRRKEIFTKELWRQIYRALKNRALLTKRISEEEFQELLKIIEFRPWNLHIEVTNICNAMCIFCAYQYMTRKKLFMSDEVYLKTLDDYCAIGGGELMLEVCVGEPLLHPNFLEYVKEARRRKEITKIATITNGIALDKFDIKEFLLSGINEIGISLAAFDEEIYTKVYRVHKKVYHRLKDNIYNLLKLNTELGCPVNISLLFRSPLTMKETLSLPDYQPLKEFPHKVEINLDFDSWRGNIKQEDLLPGMKLRPLSKLKKEPCYWLYDGPIIFADGKVGLCGCRDFNADSELIVGHIMKASLLELWQSEKTKQLRERFWQGDFPKICQECTTYADLTFYRTQEGLKRANFLKERLKEKGLL